MIMKIQSKDEWTAFKQWQIMELSLSPKVAADNLSRCRRIEKIFSINLKATTRNEKDYLILMDKIGIYAHKTSRSRFSAYALSACLRSAAKKYALFSWGEKISKYPRKVYTKNITKLTAHSSAH
ncbi:hypothetical protein [Candidatus Ferrigenium straubiae]|jgi:hypothetical protein|uniref:hypothetical protein n=1 Tax=Candidatus Ferrigenium straubiae TaxID=2919506 RepID=UPI003F4AD3F5